jgi:hypothetical protein
MVPDIGRWKTSLRDQIPFDVVRRMGKNDHKECRYSFDVVLERHSDNFFWGEP